MPTKVNRYPRGFGDLLDIRQLGQNPSILADQINGVIDMERYFFLGQERAATATGFASAVATVIPIQVPAMEAWIVTDYGVYGSTAGGEAISFAVALYGVYQNAAGTSSTVAIPVGRNAVIGASSGGSSFAARTFIAMPSDYLGVRVDACTTAGSISLTCSARYYRLSL